jgi:hypothetical protein
MEEIIAWHRHYGDPTAWSLKYVFIVPDDGQVRIVGYEDGPKVWVDNTWDLAQRMTAQHPDHSTLTVVDPAEASFLELQAKLHRDDLFTTKPGDYFSLNASGSDPVTPDDVAYGRIIRLDQNTAEVIVLGAKGAPGPLFENISSSPGGTPIESAAELVPGRIYYLSIGKKSGFFGAAPIEFVRELREQNGDWVHIPDPELDFG